jgi:hypothetical protein
LHDIHDITLGSPAFRLYGTRDFRLLPYGSFNF